MKIFKMNFTDERYHWITKVQANDLDEALSFDGRSKKTDWQPTEVQILEIGDGKKRILSNAPEFHFIGIPVFDQKTLDCLYPLIENDCEVLPLIFRGDTDFHAINITTVLDAIDYTKAEYETFSTGRIMCFDKYAFIEDKVAGYNLFKIKELKRSIMLVSELFVQTVAENNLTGFVFREIWDSSNN